MYLLCIYRYLYYLSIMNNRYHANNDDITPDVWIIRGRDYSGKKDPPDIFHDS